MSRLARARDRLPATSRRCADPERTLSARPSTSSRGVGIEPRSRTSSSARRPAVSSSAQRSRRELGCGFVAARGAPASCRPKTDQRDVRARVRREHARAPSETIRSGRPRPDPRRRARDRRYGRGDRRPRGEPRSRGRGRGVRIIELDVPRRARNACKSTTFAPDSPTQDVIRPVRPADYKGVILRPPDDPVHASRVPSTATTRLPLSRFRRLGASARNAQPAVFRGRLRVRVWRGASWSRHPRRARLGAARAWGRADSFLNLMTAPSGRARGRARRPGARRESERGVAVSFFCYPENQPRPVFPSSFLLLAPSERGGAVGLAVRCPVCGRDVHQPRLAGSTSTCRSTMTRDRRRRARLRSRCRPRR